MHGRVFVMRNILLSRQVKTSSIFAKYNGTGTAKIKSSARINSIRNRICLNKLYEHSLYQKSGLSRWVGSRLIVFESLDPWVLNLVLCSIVAVMTEVTSNAATCTLMMPILANLVCCFSLFYIFIAIESRFVFKGIFGTLTCSRDC